MCGTHASPQGNYMAKKSQSTYIVAFTLFAFGIGYMIWSGISQNGVYFLNVSEALAMESKELGAARLFGTVSKNNLLYAEDGLSVEFQLIDAQNTNQFITVQYKGTVPDTFDVGAEVIIEGAMKDDSFYAKSLMTKCPSKYEKENREQKA